MLCCHNSRTDNASTIITLRGREFNFWMPEILFHVGGDPDYLVGPPKILWLKKSENPSRRHFVDSQDCEEATLAVVAKMGAYPDEDAYGTRIHKSVAFKRFRSAVRAVMVISR